MGEVLACRRSVPFRFFLRPGKAGRFAYPSAPAAWAGSKSITSNNGVQLGIISFDKIDDTIGTG